MASISELLKQAQENPNQAEKIYKQILSYTSGWCFTPDSRPFLSFITDILFCILPAARDVRDHDQGQNLRDQEVALVKLGELYRDQKCATLPYLFYGQWIYISS